MIPLRREKPPTAEEAVALARAAQAGDKAARDRLILGNGGLAMKMAIWCARVTGAEVDDLFQVAIDGVMRAIETYDPAKGKFSTYAVPWIRAKLFRHLAMNEARCVPRSQILRNPTMQALAAAVRSRHVVSFDAPIGPDSSMPLIEQTAGPFVEPEERLDAKKLARDVRNAIARLRPTLTEIEADILDNRILDQTATLGEIGERHASAVSATGHLSRERIRQLEVLLRARLRRIFEPIHERAAA